MEPEIKFYADSHIAKTIVRQLRDKGVNIVHCQELGKENDKDVDHLEFAAAEGRTVITFDKDFPRLHKEWQEQGKIHAGIIRVNPDYQVDIGAIIKYLLFLHQAVASRAATLENDVYNRLEYL